MFSNLNGGSFAAVCHHDTCQAVGRAMAALTDPPPGRPLRAHVAAISRAAGLDSAARRALGRVVARKSQQGDGTAPLPSPEAIEYLLRRLAAQRAAAV